MPFKSREELVGKRFLSVKSYEKPKVSQISEWEWRSGFVRAVSTKDPTNIDITVLVEFDDTGWKSREYIRIHDVFQIFLVEHSLAWVERNDLSPQGQWPALTFKSVVDHSDLDQQTKKPVEFLSDRFLDIVDKEITLYKEGDEERIPSALSCPDIKELVKKWIDYQDGQKILLNTPTVLLGYRVEVYRTEGTTQWYTAVIKSYNHSNGNLTLTDDTVLEEHNEDPGLIQMHLIGDGVVDSILNGVSVGVAQRRRPRSTVTKQNSKDNSFNSIGSRNIGSSSTQKSISSNSRNTTSSNTAVGQSVTGSVSTGAKVGTSKGRYSGSNTRTNSPTASVLSGLGDSSSKDSLTSKGNNQRSGKNPSRRKSDKQESSSKAPKKSSSVKSIKSVSSLDTSDDEQIISKGQNCNVVVERIVENVKKSNVQKEKAKGKPPRLRNKTDYERKSSDSHQEVDIVSKQEESVKVTKDSEIKLDDKPINDTDKKDVTNRCDVIKEGEISPVKSVDKDPCPTPSTSKLCKPDDRDDKEVIVYSEPVIETNVCVKEENPESNIKVDNISGSDKTIKPGENAAEKLKDVSVSPSPTKNKETKLTNIGQEREKNKTVLKQPDNLQEDDSMHFKKQMLRAGEPSPNNQIPNISDGINVNISLTDQLAKRNKGNSANGDGRASSSETTLTLESRSPSTSVAAQSHIEPGTSVSRLHDISVERQSAFSSVSRTNLQNTREERADSRASDSQINLRHDDKRPGSRLEEIRSVRSSPGSSPLIIDKHETVNPYRDPELMRKNTVQSNVPGILNPQQPGFPSVVHPPPGAPTPSQPSAGASIPFPPGVPGLPARSILSSLPYSTAHPLPPSHPLSLQHGFTMDAVVRAQQQQQLILQQQQIMATGFPATHMAALEALWQRKLPANPLSQHWPLKNPEALLAAGDYAALHREHLLQLEQERRDHDRREAERLEQERREKEKRDQLERERIEKAEREKEQERRERERLERERMDKERRERERKEWEEHKQKQERILRASEVDSKTAVDQHFAASLTKLANQQGMANIFPLARGHLPAGTFVAKTEAHQSPLALSGLVYPQDAGRPFDIHKDEIKRDTDIVVSKPLEKSQFPSYHSSTSYPSQKPVFNLYGFPSSPSTISTEQLKQRGLIPDVRPPLKEELDKQRSFSPHVAMATHPPSIPSGYHKGDIKQDLHSSVIVKRDNKIKMETPMAAHSHHTSPSSSSPRPQQPRPAHTPEHRPDRPHSSASPAHLHSTASSSSHLPINPNVAFRPSDAHLSPRSQSPYTQAASQAHIPQPLDFCKSTLANKSKSIDNAVHSVYHTTVSVPITGISSLAYNSSLIQQGLVPNPIYSHPSSQPLPQHQSNKQSSPSVVPGSKPSQPSPTSVNNKRKSGGKDSYNAVHQQKRPKSNTPDMPIGTAQQFNPPMSIPVTTPQILTNPSPYTTTNSSVFYHSSLPLSNTSLSSIASSSLSSSVQSAGCLDSFKSFVDNTVQEVYQKEVADKHRNTSINKPKVIPGSSDHRTLPSNLPNTGEVTSYKKEDKVPQLPSSNLSDSYSSRIMDTINRVANNLMDTDSDTLSASSPPPQIKPTPERSSPLNKNSSGSGSSHPHHMKKAWLQRHDEDKKSETPTVLSNTEEDSNSSLSHTKDIISCVENSALSAGHETSSGSPANVVVTLPNGNISDLNHNDESTSSASEAETLNSSKAKKRAKQRKSESVCVASEAVTAIKKPKTEGESTPCTIPSTTISPLHSVNSAITSNSNTNFKKKNGSNRKVKNEKEVKPKEEPIIKKESTPTPPPASSIDPPPVQVKEEKNVKPPVAVVTKASSPHSPPPERSNPSPTLSQSNTSSSINSLSSNMTNSITSSKYLASSKENKDKKKTRKNKDIKKSSSFNKPLVKQSVQQLKRTMTPFIQDASCSEVTPKLNKCRECKMTPVQRSKKLPNIFCRFYAFRRLKYNPKGLVKIEGFSQLSDADPDDIEPWLPQYPIEEPLLDVDCAKFILSKIGEKFCELVAQEREAKTSAGEDGCIAWKRAVMGVREMCDVCDTTLFNMHWVCRKCGFVVCLDCYKTRINEDKKQSGEDKWLTCSSNRQAHDAFEMMLTQIIPSDALWELGRLIHDIRMKWSIPSSCSCVHNVVENKSPPKNGINQLLNAVNNHALPNGIGGDLHNSELSKSKKHSDTFDYNPATASSPLSILAEVAEQASMDSESNRGKLDAKRKSDKNQLHGDETEGDKKGISTLRELLSKTARKAKASNEKKSKKGTSGNTLNDIIQSVVERNCMDAQMPFKFLHYIPRLGGWKRELPIITHNLTETSVLYPDVPHSWLCDGRLLRLHDAHHRGNLQIFQEQWKRGQPVLVSCANKRMNLNLWKPEVFSKEFGLIENEVVNCRTGDVIIGHIMSDFWDGFQSLQRRPTNDEGEPMLLKLKDWPPGDDFSELLPTRFQDLMQALPLPEYTHRTGKLNLASRLPDFLVRPDLGPKMYNAYGSSYYPKEATTNLHLDISDAVNIMVFVGVPGDTPAERKAHEEAAVKAIDDADCDSITKKRVREVNEIPGALWQIYDAHDADKIRDFLNKVAKERGEIIEKDHDAIHDQSWYIDKDLGERLRKEYGVQGYNIVQCHGDAIFIPAGAPHQVRNLHSCIKVAEDFVSPEHLNHCFRLTQEFRQLSEGHSNHEDKLQVKNIVYHAVKDAIAVLREHDPKDE